MKICPKCNLTHEKNGKYCCRSCANSRTFTEESKEKKRRSGVNFYSNFSAQERKNIQAEKNKKYDKELADKKGTLTRLSQSWARPYEEMAHDSLRKRLLYERNQTCEECGISNTYNGKPLSLELDHKDGNNKNNKVENLRILCPNCHSQTPTHRAKNIKYKRLNKSIPE